MVEMSVDPSPRPQPGWLSMQTVWLALVPASLLIVLCRTAVQPNDFWWHMRTGQLILANGSLPTLDQFSFTRTGEVWVNQAWIMQIGLYLIYTWGGLPLIIWVHAVTITAGYTLVLRQVVRRHGVRVGVLSTFLGMAVTVQNWAIRPQSISFLYFGLLVFLIEQHRQGNRHILWWAAPVMALWANSHGAFLFGLGLLGLYVIGNLWDARAHIVTLFSRATRQKNLPADRFPPWLLLASQALLALISVGLNPQGPWGIVQYVLGFVRSDVTVQQNTEFVPLSFRQADGIILFIVLLIFVALLIKNRPRISTDQLLALLIFLGLSLWTRRGIAWLSFILIPLLSQEFAQLSWLTVRPLRRGKPVLNGVILAFFGLVLLIMLPWWRTALPLPPDQTRLETTSTPIAAMDFMCATFSPESRSYQHFAFASYQIWACPRLPVFADTRIELYPKPQWDDYFAIENGRFDWQQVADSYRLTHLLLDPQMQPLAIRAATAADCWESIYQDERAILFARSEISACQPRINKP